MNIDTMPAGPEMDRIVAERVMVNATMTYATAGGETTTIGVIATGGWSPSTKIAHAWEVIERLRSLKPCIGLLGDGTWSCSFEWRKHGERYMVGTTALTAPLAICRAALMAVVS